MMHDQELLPHNQVCFIVKTYPFETSFVFAKIILNASFVVVCLFVCCEEIFCIMQANAENEFKLEDQDQVEKLAEESRNKNFCRKNLKAIIGVSVLSLCLIILGGLIYWKFMTPALPPPPG